uniref:peptidylprolyl isomerase n=1 Tax=candidate division WOR-3 bacterium TaxID=2052148 RepID=A0A7C4Y518_UNCW3
MKKFLLTLVVLSLFSCKKETKKDAVVSVKGRSYSFEEICEQFNIPPQQVLLLQPDQKKQVIDYFVQNEVFYQEALSQKLDKDPDIAKRLETIKKQLLVQALFQKLMRELPQVSEIEAKAYYESHKDEYNSEIRIGRIILDNEEKAREVLNKIKSGEDFSKLAKQYSIDTIAGKKGGDYGWISKGDYYNMPEIENAAFGIKDVGGVSDIIISPFGYEIVKLLDRRKMKVERKFDNIKSSIINELTMERQKTLLDSLTNSWKTKYNVKLTEGK